MNTTNVSTVLTGLEENLEYNVSVRAYTSVGPGPYSPEDMEITFEDGRSIMIKLIIIIMCFLIQYSSC